MKKSGDPTLYSIFDITSEIVYILLVTFFVLAVGILAMHWICPMQKNSFIFGSVLTGVFMYILAFFGMNGFKCRLFFVSYAILVGYLDEYHNFIERLGFFWGSKTRDHWDVFASTLGAVLVFGVILLAEKYTKPKKA